MKTDQHATKRKQCINSEIKEEIRKYLETKNNEISTLHLMGYNKNSSKRKLIQPSSRKKYSLPQEKNLKLTCNLKELEKKSQNPTAADGKK